jgi:predicted nucleic acid-binding protein
MKKIVIDSSVAIKWFVVEPLTGQALRILEEYRNAGLRLLAPDLIFAEVGNIVWKKCLYQGLAAPDAELIIEAFSQLHIALTSSAVLLPAAYRLAIATRRTVYDTLYLALSVRENCQFISADEKLVNAVRSVFPTVLWVGDLI